MGIIRSRKNVLPLYFFARESQKVGIDQKGSAAISQRKTCLTQPPYCQLILFKLQYLPFVYVMLDNGQIHFASGDLIFSEIDFRIPDSACPIGC
jgi:hypothetical protein